MIPGITAAQSLGAAGLAEVVWDANYKHTGITLSNGDKDATKTGSWGTVLGNIGRSGGGKWAFEVICVSTAGNHMGGMADKTQTQSTRVGTYLGNSGIESMGYAVNTLYFSVSGGSQSGSFIAWGAGDVLTIALDLDAATPTVGFYVNGTLGKTATLPTGKTWFTGASIENGGVMRIRGRGLSHLPSGYSEWS
jgi:hypothetical protein